MSGNASVFSRFLIKFVEIIAAGLATAVSGYLIAHLSGAVSSPVPEPARAVIAPAPEVSPPVQPPSSIPGDPSEQQNAAKEAASPAPQLGRPVSAAKIAPPRKHTETATSAAQSKREQQSLVARVRDALANMDASRSGLPAAPAHEDVRVDPAGPASQPQSSADSGRSAVTGAASPSTGQSSSVPTQPAQPNPLIAVEIQSRPVAAAQPPPAAPAEPETGIVSTLEQMLRHDPLAGSEEAPRPPLPVGQ
jgi:hypothetical protein